MGLYFVGGYLRSGTTMLQTILCASQECNPMIGEAIFLRGILESYCRCLGMFDMHSKYYFSDKEDLRRLCEKHVRDFIKKTSDRYNRPRHIVLKHPQLTLLFPFLHDLVQEAKFIIVVRDPRDTVASAVSARERGALEFGSMSPKEIAGNLFHHYNACLSCKSESFRRNTMYVKYEDLVQSPYQVVKRIQDFAGIDLSDFDQKMENIRTEVNFDQESKQEDPLHSSHYGKNVSSARIGRFSSILDGRVVLEIEQVCRPLFERFDYVPSAKI